MKKYSLILSVNFIESSWQYQPGLRSRSRKESEVFGWSRIPTNTGSRSRIFLSDYGCPIGSFFTCAPKL